MWRVEKRKNVSNILNGCSETFHVVKIKIQPCLGFLLSETVLIVILGKIVAFCLLNRKSHTSRASDTAHPSRKRM